MPNDEQNAFRSAFSIHRSALSLHLAELLTVELLERFEHRDDVLARHPRARAAADREDHALAVRRAGFETLVRGFLYLVRRAAHADLQRVDVAHQAHAVADAFFDFADVLLLAPIEHVEAGVRQVVEAR